MTKSDFLERIPDIINHKTRGYAELEIFIDKNGEKGVCYRDTNKRSSCGTHGSTWFEVFEDLSKYLISQGYMEAEE